MKRIWRAIIECPRTCKCTQIVCNQVRFKFYTSICWDHDPTSWSIDESNSRLLICSGHYIRVWVTESKSRLLGVYFSLDFDGTSSLLTQKVEAKSKIFQWYPLKTATHYSSLDPGRTCFLFVLLIRMCAFLWAKDELHGSCYNFKKKRKKKRERERH